MDYKKAGVDIEAGYKSVELMKKYVQGTMRPEVLTNLLITFELCHYICFKYASYPISSSLSALATT